MICVPCKKIYRPEKNGVYVQEMMPGRNSHEMDPETGWSPYKLWVGDRWKCPGCGHEVIGGIPLQPIAEHYQPQFAQAAEAAKAIELHNVADCGNIHGGQAGMPRTSEYDRVKLEVVLENVWNYLESSLSPCDLDCECLLHEVEDVLGKPDSRGRDS